MNPDVDTSHRFGYQCLRAMKEGEPLLTRDEYLIRIQDFEDLGCMNLITQFSNGKSVNDMSLKEVAELYASVKKKHWTDLKNRTIDVMKRL